MLADLVDGADVGMIQSRGCAGLPQQPGPGGSVVEAGLRQDLDGHVPIELLVVSAVDHAHAAFAELFCDLIMTERLADHGSAPSLLSDGACCPQE